MHTVWLQFNIFISALLWGLILGVVFDVYRFLFPSNKVKGIVQYILDSVFWLIVTLATFGVLIFADHGQVRIYLLFAMALGYLIYMLILSKVTIKILIQIKKFLIKVYKIVYRTFRWIFNVIYSIGKAIMRVLLFLLFPFRWVINLITRPVLRPIKKIFNKISRK